MEAMISIVTVCYNAQDSIEKTLKSILEQNYNDYEYIIIDGASTDNTLSIINRYIPLFKERKILVKLISEHDKGIYDAMNKGAELARGHWINFMNSDDIFFDGNVLKEVFSNDLGSFNVVYGRALWETSNGISEFTTRASWYLKYKKPFYHQAAFVKTKLQKQYKFNLNYKISADFDFFQRLYLKKYKFLKLDYIVAVSSDHGISKDVRNINKIYKEDQLIIKNNGVNIFNSPILLVFNWKKQKEINNKLKANKFEKFH
ncbi:glycosyltransferase family 2 protein [Clostridium sp.]|uniref:glycosyltransferase family 2 protein n=1 Tax=Clostridium sp. TaxID=1506 RepID=UPI001A44502E|nr:glycosyltransferase family 2 protein [Clostridium sp.]MBK5241005.1 glycosyltransferase [Clostridium sp.]